MPPGGHGDASEGDPPRQGQHFHDNQRDGVGASVSLRSRSEKAGGAVLQDKRHPSERHFEGVHRQGHLHLPAQAVHAVGGRRVQVLLGKHSPVEHHQRERLPHAGGGGDGGAGVGVHIRQRHRVRAGGGGRRVGRGRIPPVECLSSSFLTTTYSRKRRSSGRPVGCGPRL